MKKSPSSKLRTSGPKRVNAPRNTETGARGQLSVEAQKGRFRSRIRAVMFGAFALLSGSVAAGIWGVDGKFSFWVDKVGGTETSFTIGVGPLWLGITLAFAASAVLQFVRGAAFRWRLAIGLIAPLLVFGLLARLLDGTTANLTVFLTNTLSFAIPVGIGAIAGIVAERSGFLNIAVEGKLLVGALVGSVVSSVTGIAFLGPIGGALIGALISLFLAILGIRYKVDQIIAGTVINIGAVGITSVIFQRILQPYREFNNPVNIDPISIPVLSDIPVFGPILFALSPYFYIALGLVLFFTYMIFKTRWGLRLRSSGELPSAAGTVGVDVVRLRYRAMLIAGLLAGFAGSFISLGGTGGFAPNSSAGKGFIALAAVIFGAWNPIYAFGAALTFGMASSAASLLAGLGVKFPPQILGSVPYVVTIIVVAGLIGRVRGPASAGQPYDQG
ncbi:MAG: ABC transporter permease [Chloroflexi bacterium]|nr:ABC transporter permease [Chloroflexota bacterium]